MLTVCLSAAAAVWTKAKKFIKVSNFLETALEDLDTGLQWTRGGGKKNYLH